MGTNKNGKLKNTAQDSLKKIINTTYREIKKPLFNLVNSKLFRWVTLPTEIA